MGFLGVIGGSSISYSFLVLNGGGKDKRAREAIKMLSKEIGMQITIYDTIDPSVYRADYYEENRRRLLDPRDFENTKKIEETIVKHHNWYKGISEYFGIAYSPETTETKRASVVLVNPKAPAYTVPATTVPKRKRNR